MEIPDYHLPEEAIAQEPLARRDQARLLDATDLSEPVHRRVWDLPELLEPGDLLVVNSTRVVPARLRLVKASGASAEVLLVGPEPSAGEGAFRALVRPGRRLAPGTRLISIDTAEELVEVGEAMADGQRVVTLLAETQKVLELAEVALPPYIRRRLEDPERYQTVYAKHPGSLAAPTAGLHLTSEVLERISQRGVQIAEVDLQVGLGTFAPIKATRVEAHQMHAETYRVPARTWRAVEEARRVVAVGTTTVRALESVAAGGPLEGESRLYIRPGHRFGAVDVLMTNFHQPRSSLLVLLEAFVGPAWRELYSLALGSGYRFLSFGDAMLVSRQA